MGKANIIAAILIAVIAVLSVTPSAMAETEGAQLEFPDFYPASLTYDVGEVLGVTCVIYNSGTAVIETATVCINVISPNGTCVFDFSYEIEHSKPDMKREILSRYLWLIDENTTAGKYTIEAILRWDSEVIQKNTFFYVPEEPAQIEPELEITSLYTQRIVYKQNEVIPCTCRIRNNGNESAPYYISMCITDHNGTMINGMAGKVYSIEADKKAVHIFTHSVISEPGMYTVEAILWWNNTATSKTAKFSVDDRVANQANVVRNKPNRR